MAFCRLVFPLLVLSVICSASNVPVYIWGDLPEEESVKANPLTIISTTDFNDIVENLMKEKPLTVVFVEQNLSVEDLSRRNNGDISYKHLHAKIGDAVYLPVVENPLSQLNEIADPEESASISLTEVGLSAEIPPKSLEDGKFLFISLKDAREGESRADMLQRHDEFMEEMYLKLKEENDKLIAIYTARHPSWTTVAHSRSRRAANTTTDASSYVTDSMRLYASAINIIAGNDTYALTGYTGSTTSLNDTSGTLSTKLMFNNGSLTLNFHQRGGYWFFNNVTLEQPSMAPEEMYPAEELFAFTGFSYRCKEVVSFTSKNETVMYTVVFRDMKIQPFLSSNDTFGDSINCVGFFSAPIWAGLMVVFILLLITFYGIMMIMDIRTMDRFDDPKGKTITINASE